MAVSECKEVARIDDSPIYCILDTAFISFANTSWLDLQQRQTLEKSYAELRKWLGSQTFYFSHDIDVTKRFSSKPTKRTATSAPLWTTVDPHFFWNRHALQLFILNKLDNWIMPIMNGFVQSTTCRISGHAIDLLLISRVSCLRAGTRFNARGVNDDGNVANFVETEQILFCGKKFSSFVQTRVSSSSFHFPFPSRSCPSSSSSLLLFSPSLINKRNRALFQCFGNKR